MLRNLTLQEWAQRKYSSHPPALGTLRQYAKNNFFNPPARKEGRYWRVREDAELVGNLERPEVKTNDNPLLKRILNDGCETTEK